MNARAISGRIPTISAIVVSVGLFLVLGSGPAQGRTVARDCPDFRLSAGTVYEYSTKGITCKAGKPLIRKWVRTGNYCSGVWEVGSGSALTCVNGRRSISFYVAHDGD